MFFISQLVNSRIILPDLPPISGCWIEIQKTILNAYETYVVKIPAIVIRYILVLINIGQ